MGCNVRNVCPPPPPQTLNILFQVTLLPQQPDKMCEKKAGSEYRVWRGKD